MSDDAQHRADRGQQNAPPAADKGQAEDSLCNTDEICESVLRGKPMTDKIHSKNDALRLRAENTALREQVEQCRQQLRAAQSENLAAKENNDRLREALREVDGIAEITAENARLTHSQAAWTALRRKVKNFRKDIAQYKRQHDANEWFRRSEELRVVVAECIKVHEMLEEANDRIAAISAERDALKGDTKQRDALSSEDMGEWPKDGICPICNEGTARFHVRRVMGWKERAEKAEAEVAKLRQMRADEIAASRTANERLRLCAEQSLLQAESLRAERDKLSAEIGEALSAALAREQQQKTVVERWCKRVEVAEAEAKRLADYGETWLEEYRKTHNLWVGAEADAARLRLVLARLEWINADGFECPACCGHRDVDGHTPDCWIAAALRPAEWVTENERTVKWDKEQTAYLRKKLPAQPSEPGAAWKHPLHGWEFACKWYKEEEIKHALERKRGTDAEIPEDVHSAEFANWLTLQYRLAMAKGIQIGGEQPPQPSEPERMQAALEEVIAALGSKPLPCCDGCAAEWHIALAAARAGLGIESEPGPVCERCGDTGCPACTLPPGPDEAAAPPSPLPADPTAVWKCLRPECGKTFNKFPFSQLCPACNAACAKVTTPADPDRGRVVREKMQSMEACQSMIRREWERLNSKDRAYYNAIYDAVAADLKRKEQQQ